MKGFSPSDSERLYLRVTGTLAVITILVCGTVIFLPMLQQSHHPRKNVVIWAKVPEARRAEVLEKTKRMRENMRAWAESHQSDISAMQAGDYAAFQRVYEAIPEHPVNNDRSIAGTIGIRSEDQYDFIWPNHANKTFKTLESSLDPLGRERWSSSVKIENIMLKHHWEHYRDILVTQSTIPGQFEYSLWASGRITMTEESASARGITQMYTMRKEHDVLPAYNFYQPRR